MGVTQTDFRSALLDPAHATPPGLINPDGSTATKRFDVYRNNVASSLTEALEVSFPVIRKLIGDQNFKGLAGIFLRQHPPSTPILMFYGHEMPGFLEGFEPLAHLPYLADVARLELSLRESYHAADAAAFDPAILKSLSEAQLSNTRVTFAPAVRLIRSRYPIYGIWQMNMVESAPKLTAHGENVLVTRPEFDPIQTVLIPGAGLFVQSLMAGTSFGESLAIVAEKVPDFNLSEALIQLLASAALETIQGT
ncbi:MAG: DNA-binding domain-containing protein [Pseudomonadota bacterium]